MLSGTPNTIKFALLATMTLSCWSSMVKAQFAKFIDETSERSVALGSLFSNDIAEKDYAGVM